MKQITQVNVNYPIFDACLFRNVVLVCGGGGGKKFGIQNKLEVLNGNSLLSQQILNDDLLFQQVQISELDDIIVANTDLDIFIYKQVFDKTELIKKMSFKEDELQEITVHFKDNMLIYQDTQQIVHITQIENDVIINLFELQMNQPVQSFLIIKPSNIIVFCFQNEVLVFCLKTKTFIQKIKLEKKQGQKLFLSYYRNHKKDVLLNIVDSCQKQTQMYTYLYQNQNLELIAQIVLCQNKITAYERFENIILVSLPEGDIRLYKLHNHIVSLIKSIKAHNFPISKFVVRRAINYEEDKIINIMSFGTDSIINMYEVQFDKLIEKYYQDQLKKYGIILILFLAFLIAFLMKGKQQTKVVQEIQ